MHTPIRAVAAALLLLSAGATGCDSTGITPAHTAAHTTAAAITQVGADPPAAVTYVTDGDTLHVTINGQDQKVRVLGINAPELAHDGRPAQCGGQDAREALRALVQHQVVTLIADPGSAQVDRYGRWLRYVELDGRDIGQEMIRAGRAMEYHPRSAPAESRAAAYLAAQEQARAQSRGQWRTCTLHQVTMQPPPGS